MAPAADLLCSAPRLTAGRHPAAPAAAGSGQRHDGGQGAAPQQLLQQPAVWPAWRAGACGCACAAYLGPACAQDQGQSFRCACLACCGSCLCLHVLPGSACPQDSSEICLSPRLVSDLRLVHKSVCKLLAALQVLQIIWDYLLPSSWGRDSGR